MKKNNKKGFTLVELVIVVAVMAILVAVAIPTISSITSSAQDSTDKSNARTVESMIKLAEANGKTSADDIAQYLFDASLGIESGKFLYNEDTGECEVTSANTATAPQVLVTFGKGTGEGAKYTVTYGTGSADTATVVTE